MQFAAGILWFILALLRVAEPVEAAKPDAQVPARVQELNKQVEKAYQRGDYRRGLERAQKAYEEAKRSLGAEHPDTLTSLHNLAQLYQAQGQYREAELFYQKALQLCEKVRGPEHPDTLESLNDLAMLYQAQGRYEEAEPFLQKALRLREKVLGPEHPTPWRASTTWLCCTRPRAVTRRSSRFCRRPGNSARR
jgi:tetratricopeptide (TPR) repeat protein